MVVSVISRRNLNEREREEKFTLLSDDRLADVLFFVCKKIFNENENWLEKMVYPCAIV